MNRPDIDPHRAGPRTLRLPCILAVLVLGGCTWVKVSESGAQVAVRAAADVAHCARIGTVSGSTAAKVVIQRDTRKVQEEVTALGKNEAARLGGNSIVAKGELTDGSQEFDVYRCP